MSDIDLDETIIYSADVWPSVAIGMPEVQAHVMNYPQAQDDQIRQIQDDVRRGFEIVLGVPVQEPVDDLTAARNEILRLSAELTYRTQLAESIEWSLRGQLADKDAEIERLRKEREDESGGKKCSVVRASIGRDLLNARLNSVVADPLDHRLGLPQPDGEPVEPMSAKKPYRWGAL